MVSSGASASGSFKVRLFFEDGFPIASSPINILPMFCTVPSAISIPCLATSAVTSAVLLIAVPVE